MTTTTFLADSAHQFVNWNDPARWSGGVVPNSPTVDVIIPKITASGTGNVYISFVQVTDTFTVSSVSLANNYLVFNGAGNLTVAHNLTISDSGEIDLFGGGVSLSAGSIDNNGIDIQGSGNVTTTGLFLNETIVNGQGLNLTAGSLTNVGSLIAGGGNLTVTVTHGGFTNLSGSTLSGGSYVAGGAPGNLYLNVGSVIDTDAAKIAIDIDGAIYSYDDVSHAYVSLASSLHSIAASGSLMLGRQTYNWSNLTVDGSLTVSSATLNATQLTVDNGGKVFGIGTIGGPIVNNGTIIAGPIDGVTTNFTDTLLITGTITGSGTIEIASARITTDRGRVTYSSVPLELAGAVSSDVFFDDGRGTLTLDDYADFTGKIRPAATGDAIILKGVAYSSVTSYAYSGDGHQGTLAIQTTGGEIDLQFLGNFDTAAFHLMAGPKPLSSDPDSLQIGVGSAPTTLDPIAENSGATLITQDDLLANFVGTSPVATGLAISGGLGTLVDNHNGTWSYTPAHDDESSVTFSYQVNYNTGTAAESATLDIIPTPQVFDPMHFELAAFGHGGGGGGWASDNQYPRTVADVNGDGMADIVGFGGDRVIVSLATGNGHFGPLTAGIDNFGFNAAGGGWVSQDQYPRQLADVNGDGKADIVGFGADGVIVSLATGGGHFASPVSGIQNFAFNPGGGGWTSENQYPRQLADVNGDGMADIVGFGADGVIVSLATGGGHFASPVSGIQNFGFTPAGGGWTSQDQYPRLLADVNGDGKADIVGFGADGVIVSLATGGGHFASPVSGIQNFGFTPTGGGWTSENQYPRLLADVNDDHMADIVGFGADGAIVSLATGNGHFASPVTGIDNFAVNAGSWISQDVYPRALGDINGDHMADIVGFGEAGVYEALSNGFHLI
jgi:hypothetical protein